ncbi:MAG: hypothetical protein LBD20_08175 [Spirochaetaceae bacterium]|jgi:hypothetical protein|nr:hypothetical protein [Spirochaetaceae bacterium]
MKKLIVAGVFMLCCAGFGFSETIAEVFEILDANIRKYPYAHLIAINKYDDDRAPRNPVRQFQRLPYTSEFLDDDGNPLQGEMFYLTLIKAGYRYYLNIDFLPRKEKNARDIKTVRGQILRIVRDLPEAEILTKAQDTVE